MTKQSIKVALIIPDLAAGGAEKVATILVNNSRSESLKFEIITLKPQKDFVLSPSVKYHCLNAGRVRYAWIPLIKFLKKNQPDIILAFNVNNLNFLIAIARLFVKKETKYITREATVLSLFLNNYGRFKSSIFLFLHKNILSRFDRIIALSTDMKADLIKKFEVKERNIALINNPIDIEDIQNKSKEFSVPNHKTIVFIGRIHPDKRIEFLLESLSNCTDKTAILEIIGDIPPNMDYYKIELDNLITKLNIQDQVSFLGFKSNPFPYLKNARALCISSPFEGFPNVALEANALGIPVIAFDVPGGIKDIIDPEINGILVQDGDLISYGKAIDKTLESVFDSDKIKQLTMERFSADAIVKKYEDLLIKVLNDQA